MLSDVETPRPHTATAADGVNIAYQVVGEGTGTSPAGMDLQP